MSILQTTRVIAADIKIAHSIFALPFALLGAFMAAGAPGNAARAAPDWGVFAGQLLLVVAAMVCARTVAMLANRLIDREIDRRNPRTAGRALPSGRLRTRSAAGALLAAAAAFMAVCCAFGVLYQNWWPAGLGVPVLLWISAYGWFKRFTALAHVYLGSSLAISPLAAALAVQPTALGQQPALWLLAATVLCWVAGFDIIYALQDVEVDRSQGLYSMPARLGVGSSLWVSRALHAAAAAALVGVALADGRLSLLFGLAVAAVVALLIYEHATVARWGTTRLALAFFTINGVISCLLGAAGVLDVGFV